jgi:adenine-specific DNA methylase
MHSAVAVPPAKPEVHHRRRERPEFIRAWTSKSTTSTDSTFHQLAPYIGRLKTSIAHSIIADYSAKGDLIVDPFSGSGVVGLEAAMNARNVLVADWNPYAVLLTRAKLFPPPGLEVAKQRLIETWKLSRKAVDKQVLRTIPAWVRKFFHPETL